MLKYIELNKAKLKYITIKEFKDERDNLKAILNDIEKIEANNKQQQKIWNNRKKKKELKVKKGRIKGGLELRILTFKNRYFARPNNIEDEIELRNVTSKKIDEIHIKLKIDLEKMERLVIERKFKTDELLLELYYDI